MYRTHFAMLLLPLVVEYQETVFFIEGLSLIMTAKPSIGDSVALGARVFVSCDPFPQFVRVSEMGATGFSCLIPDSLLTSHRSMPPGRA